MPKLKELVKGHTVFVGVGNPLREDDYVGCFITERLKGRYRAFTVEVNPEVYIDEIVGTKPDTIIVFDAADFGGKPGKIRLIDENEIDNFTISTHTIPLSFFVHLLKMKSQAQIYIVGIQPLSLGYREGLTETLKNAALKIIKELTS